MISEIDLLKEDIPRLEQKFGPDNLFVEVLKAQLDTLQDPTGQKRKHESDHEGFLGFIKSLIAPKN